MARTPRSQRRARRAQQAESKQQVQRARGRQQQVRPAAQPQKQQTGRREPKQRARFVRESWAELRKVEWPGRSQVIQGSVVVVIACAIVGAYLYLADLVLKNVVEQIL
jgi:preprotein translocase subunit SecE